MSLFDSISSGGVLAGAQIGTDIYNTYVQDKIARQNLKFQRENLAYQKDVQNKEWMREDTAVQRRKEDLMAAGLSPVLAAGSAANAGPVVATQAPRRDPVTIPDTAAKVMALIRGQQDIAQSNAQIDFTKAQTAKAQAEKVGQDISNAIKNRDFQINKASALPSDASPLFKTLRDGASVFDQAIENTKANVKATWNNIFGGKKK